MMPLEAAMSMRFTARRRAVASSSLPTAFTAFFVRVSSSDLTALLSSRSSAFCLLRLIWLLIFATKENLVLRAQQLAARACRCYQSDQEPFHLAPEREKPLHRSDGGGHWSG